MPHNYPSFFKPWMSKFAGLRNPHVVSIHSGCSALISKPRTRKILGNSFSFFKPWMSKAFASFCGSLILSGCVGSEVRVQDQEAMNRPFPQLQTVPDRPEDLGKEERDENLQELEHVTKDKWSLNQRLRDQYNMETDPCQQ